MLAVGKVLPTLGNAGGAAEVVDRDRGVAELGEAERKLLVEAVEAAHVGKDHDADPGRLIRGRMESGKAVAVRRLELEIVVRDRSACDRGHRWHGVELEAHGLWHDS